MRAAVAASACPTAVSRSLWSDIVFTTYLAFCSTGIVESDDEEGEDEQAGEEGDGGGKLVFMLLCCYMMRN